jgi:hypothetical protein
MFQRVTAEIVQISGVQAVLSIDGHLVVARLASKQEAAELAGQKLAQFVVTGMDEQTVILKIFRPPQTSPAGAAAAQSVQDMAARILQQSGLPLRPEMLILARAALNHNVPVNLETLQHMLTALGSAGWGQVEADQAAALYAAGLPLTPGSLLLTLRARQDFNDALAHLLISLRSALTSGNLPAEQSRQMQAVYTALQQLILPWNANAQVLAQHLRRMVRFLGCSLESILNGSHPLAGSPAGENTILELVRLMQMLRNSGQNELADRIERFLDQARLTWLLNARPDPQPGRGAWTEIGAFLAAPSAKADENPLPARLRVARRCDSKNGEIDAGYTSLTVQVEIKPGQVFQVGLSLLGKQMRARITAPGEEWLHQARCELPALEHSLAELGYALCESRLEIGDVNMIPPVLQPAAGKTGMAYVDLEA